MRATREHDRCYLIPTRDGKDVIRVRAGRKPDAKTVAALQDLFDAAFKYMSRRARPRESAR